MPISYPRSNDSIETTTSTSEEEAAASYTRPSDWLALPEVSEGDEKIVGLYAVYDTDSNFVAFQCEGAYTIDWGDGNVEDVATGVTAEHVYDSDTYAALGEETDCSRGYRQAIITITPQVGQSLTSVSFDHRHSTLGSREKKSQWLDISMAGESVSSLVVGGDTGYLTMLEQFEFVGTNAITELNYTFRYCYSLQNIELDTSNVDRMHHTFSECYSLQTIPQFDTSNLTTMSYTFSKCYSLLTIPQINTSNTTDMHNAFQDCISLSTIPELDTSSVVDMVEMFSGCYSLQTVPPLNTNNVTSMSSFKTMFTYCYSLQSAPLQGTKITHYFWSCSLARDELVEIFNGLADLGAGSATISISGNWGVADLSAEDLAIATDKGWTVTS